MSKVFYMMAYVDHTPRNPWVFNDYDHVKSWAKTSKSFPTIGIWRIKPKTKACAEYFKNLSEGFD